LSNKTVSAANLLVACLHYGLVLPHLPLTQNPTHALVSNRSIGLLSDATPSLVLKIFVQNVLNSNAELSVEYLINIDCISSSCVLNTIPFSTNELKESFKLQAQSVVMELLETFILSIDRNELIRLVGEPYDNYNFNNNNNNNDNFNNINSAENYNDKKLRYRTGGKLDQYMDEKKIDVLLSLAAYHSLSKNSQVDVAIFFYLLSGSYVDAVENICNQLNNCIVAFCIALKNMSSNDLLLLTTIKTTAATATTTPSKYATTTLATTKSNMFLDLQQKQSTAYISSLLSQRDYWKKISENFIQKYLNHDDNNEVSIVLKSLTQSGHRSLIDVLLILTKICYFLELIVDNRFDDALQLLDQLHFLPMNDDEIELKTSIHPLLRVVMDVMLIETLKCLKNSFEFYVVEKRNNSGSYYSGGSNGLFTDKDLKIKVIKERSKVLLKFANKIKTKLNNSDTISILNSIDSSMIV
jgi:hypothetical protein